MLPHKLYYNCPKSSQVCADLGGRALAGAALQRRCFGCGYAALWGRPPGRGALWARSSRTRTGPAWTPAAGLESRPT
jgi:hypothetical protein